MYIWCAYDLDTVVNAEYNEANKMEMSPVNVKWEEKHISKCERAKKLKKTETRR